MRSLGSTLTAAQKAMGDFLVKLVLTQQGDSTTKTYGIGTTNRILNLSHPEQEYSQTAQILIDNRDNNLTALTLEGYIGVISYGYNTSSGDEYSATAPLTVISQKTDSLQGELVTSFSLAGLFNLWSLQKATESYVPEDTNGDTVKVIMDAIAAPTLTCFSGYPAHTITYDTGYDDSIINAFTPKDYYSIAKGESRLSAFKKALEYTKCKARVENDAGTATIHIFQPTITGETYDYEYNDAYGDYHNFFDKSVRTRLVLPNKVVVMNHPDHADSYTGNDTDSSSYAALGNQYYTETHYVRPASNAQCDLIADAILAGYQLAAERGHGTAPMNCGQEVMDYIKITDSKANDTRIGNIGFLNRWYTAYPKQPTRFGFEFRFGGLFMPGLAGTQTPSATVSIADPTVSMIQNINLIANWLLNLDDRTRDLQALINQVITYLIGREEVIPKLHVTEQLIIPVWIPGAPLISTQAVSDIATTTATGNGNITDLGVPNPTAYGVCWDTSSDPTTSDSTTDEGAATATGAFTTSMTSLSSGTLYYVKAYATNSTGTGYGSQVTFTTL